MDTPKEESRHISKRKGRVDRKMGKPHKTMKGQEDRYVAKHREGSIGVTKRDFMELLTKAAQPISEKIPDSKETGTSAVHPSDGYSGKRKSRGKTEGKEG